MRRTTNRRGTVISLIAILVALSGLTACGGTTDMNLAQALESCSTTAVEQVRAKVNEASTEDAPGARKNALSDLGIEDSAKAIENAKDSLVEHLKDVRAKTADCAEQASATPTATPSATETAANCPKRFVQRDLTDPERNRLVEGGINAKTAQKASDKNLAMLGHQAGLLHAVATKQFHLKDTPKASKMVTADGTCLSESGQQVHHDLGVVMDASTKQFAEAPANGYNTGAKDGQLVVSRTAGVSGDRKAVKYTLPDGSVAYTMVRCANPVFLTPPKDVPPGPTDNPPPTNPPPDGGGCEPGECPPPSCPPGSLKPECSPKSSNPDDWEYPEGKPPVTADPKPDSSPPPVKTSQPGGGGVTDSPTKAPGSETGGTAPGASPAPTDGPRDTSTPEGGNGGDDTNDGTVDEP